MPLSVTRRLLKGADNPDAVADWQGDDASVWNDQLDAEIYTTLTTADATGAVLTTTDAKGNLQRVAYDVAGLLPGSWLTLKGGKEQGVVKSLTYSAAGQKLREEHGNGVVTTYTYEAETQRLTGIKTERPAGHASGAKVLQELRYEYDPVGNVLKITSDAEETRFWRNQKVVPENTYAYDSLYQLVSATGREMANAGQQLTVRHRPPSHRQLSVYKLHPHLYLRYLRKPDAGPPQRPRDRQQLHYQYHHKRPQQPGRAEHPDGKSGRRGRAVHRGRTAESTAAGAESRLDAAR